jgi:hypothetical protein
MSAIKAYSHQVAEIYENGIIQRRVVLVQGKTTNQKIRKKMLTRLYKEIEKAAAMMKENNYWIELKYS